MRENGSDGEGAWAQPPGSASPWVSPAEDGGQDEPTLTRWAATSPPPPAASDYPDTAAFATPPGYANQAGYGGARGAGRAGRPPVFPAGAPPPAGLPAGENPAPPP